MTPDECFQCGEELAKALFADDKYQVVFATHLDRDHLHNHFVVNAVNPYDGKKLQTDHAFIRRMREENDRICKAHNLSVIEEPKGKGKSYAEWITEKQGGFTWRGIIRQDIDAALPGCKNLQQLLDTLHVQGYRIRYGKHLAVSPPGTNTFFRLYKLGQGYTEEDLSRRILNLPVYIPSSEIRPFQPVRVTVVRVKLLGTFSGVKKRGGIRNMYLYYLIRLRQVLNIKPAAKRRFPPQVQKDARLASDFAEDLRLLWDNRIDSFEQLTEFYLAHSSELETLSAKESNLKDRLLHCTDPEQLKNIQGTLEVVERKIRITKRELRSAERIYKRSDRLRETIPQINTTLSEMKGRNQNVSRSRSNGHPGTDFAARD